MNKCMFGCPPDNYDTGDHWDLVCQGNPDVDYNTTIGENCQ